MAETSGFFDAEELVDGTYDREYVAEQWANYFKLFVGNGVFASPTNQLKVKANSGMIVKVLPGWGWINGYWYHNDADLAVTIPANVTVVTRVDGIFLRFDSSERRISVVVGAGRTTPNRAAPYYELKLAEVTVAVGATAISDVNIEDTRADTSVCGFVTGLIDVIDSTDLFAQYQSIFNNFMTENGSEFNTWFNHMKDQLDSDAAGHLQAEIDALNATVDVTVPTTGWSGEAPTLTNTINVQGVTSTSQPFVTVKYPDGVSVADKKAIGKAANLFVKMETGNGTVTITAIAIPATVVTLELRGI